MNFRETLKPGTAAFTSRELVFYKKHDSWVTTEFPADTTMMIWGFRRFTDEIDPATMIEIEFLHNSDLWCLAIPHGDVLENYFTFA